MSTALDESTVADKIRELSAQAVRLEGEAAEANAEADALVGRLTAEGRSPLTDASSFELVDQAYKKGSTLSEQAADARRGVESWQGISASRNGGRSSGPIASLDAAFRTAAEKMLAHPSYQEAIADGRFLSNLAPLGDLPAVKILERDELVEVLTARASMFGPRFKAATLDAASMIAPDARYFPPAGFPVYTPRVVDLVTTTTTNSDLVMYVEETTRTDAAVETALGDPYPQATYIYTPAQAAVADIGHWVPAHRSQMADQGQLQGLISGRLEDGVRRRLDGQIMQGAGTSGTLKGILNTSRIGSIGRNGTTSERVLEAIHRGITWVRINGFIEPDAVVIHPTDYEKAVFEKGSDGQYLLGPAAAATARTIWGFPAAITVATPQGTVVPGNYRNGAILWVRSGVTTRVGDQHEDFFVRRMVAILAEMRAAFAAWVPSNFAAVDVT